MDIMTPSYLFSVISMFLMGYNTRYLAITKLVRNRFNGNNCNLENRELEILKTFRKRLDYIKKLQIYAILSMLVSTIAIFFNLFKWKGDSLFFILSLVFFMVSLIYSLMEIKLSTNHYEEV